MVFLVLSAPRFGIPERTFWDEEKNAIKQIAEGDTMINVLPLLIVANEIPPRNLRKQRKFVTGFPFFCNSKYQAIQIVLILTNSLIP